MYYVMTCRFKSNWWRNGFLLEIVGALTSREQHKETIAPTAIMCFISVEFYVIIVGIVLWPG